MAKYNPDTDHWDDDTTTDPDPRAEVVGQTITVMYDDEPDPEDNYGRTKYEVKIRRDDDRGLFVLYAIGYRWKGNYWRDTTDWDWRDLPDAVREAVTDALPADRPAALDGGSRLMDEGGESRWQKHHKPQMDKMRGDEMWGASFLSDALEYAENAAESFEAGSRGEQLAENAVEAIQRAITVAREDGNE